MQDPKLEQILRGMADRNWHIHTVYSPCAASEMTIKNIVAMADRAKLQIVALVDHHHPGDTHLLTRMMSLKAMLERLPHKAIVIVGAELSAYGEGLYAEDEEANQMVDYRLYASNHYHLNGWEHPRKPSPEAYKEHTLAVLRRLIPSGRAGCIAHPFVASYLAGHVEDLFGVTRAYADRELGDLFELAKRHGVAWEVSTRHLPFDPLFARRYLRLGLEIGVDFRLGTDAHTLRDIDPRPQVEHLIEVLRAG